jgi:hypothetical protein
MEVIMNEYQNLYQKFLGFAFIVGPLLYFIGTLFMPLGNLGIGGMIAPFGVALLIPVFMEMGCWIGQVQPRYGFACTVLALLTTAGNTAATFAWAISEALTNDLALTSDETWLYSSNDPYIFPFFLLAVLFPIMTLLIAIGLWRNRLTSRWIPGLFVVASISFLVFVVAGYMEETMFPVPVFIWLVALAPMGWRILTGRMDDLVGEAALA